MTELISREILYEMAKTEPRSPMAGYTQFIAADQYYLRKPIYDKQEAWGVKTIPTDANGGAQFPKEGNGLGKDPQLFSETQENIHVRFGLQSPADFEKEAREGY